MLLALLALHKFHKLFEKKIIIFNLLLILNFQKDGYYYYYYIFEFIYLLVVYFWVESLSWTKG